MALAAELSRMGFRKGDFLAASLPLLDEHILLEYACFRLGVIHAPLDLRLQPAEVLRCLGLIRARGYAFPGRLREWTSRRWAKPCAGSCDFVEHLIQFAPPGECDRRRRQLRRCDGARQADGTRPACHRT